MDKISMIILNYNDSCTALSLADEVKDYECLDPMVMVDNHSSDDSWKHLQILNDSGKVHALRLEQNGDYGTGNQEGINYAVSCLKVDYVIIVNPDIHVTPRCIRRVKDALNKAQGAVAASARVKDPTGRELFSYWTLLPLQKDLLDTGLVVRRLFKVMLNMPSCRLAYAGDEGCRLVDAVPGSFFMLKTGILTPGEIKEIFDKHIFLCYGEKVLGQKFRRMGLKTVLVTDESYVHTHSVSIDKSFERVMDKQRLLHRSKLYYYKEYLGTGPTGMAAARAVLGLALAEVWFLTVVCKVWWQDGVGHRHGDVRRRVKAGSERRSDV